MGSVPRKFDLSSVLFQNQLPPSPLSQLSPSLCSSQPLSSSSLPLSLMAAALLLVLGPRRHRPPTSGARQWRLQIWARATAAAWSCGAHRSSPPPLDVGSCGGGGAAAAASLWMGSVGPWMAQRAYPRAFYFFISLTEAGKHPPRKIVYLP